MANGNVKGSSSRRSRNFEGEDFQEEVWVFMKDMGRSSSILKQRINPKASSSSSSSSFTPRMMIPKKEMNNPRREHNKRSSGNGPSWVCYDNGNGDDLDDSDEIVPPHEYIARRLARTQISCFSVYEGVGRKLKGRDLSNVRNDVLRMTGFLES